MSGPLGLPEALLRLYTHADISACPSSRSQKEAWGKLPSYSGKLPLNGGNSPRLMLLYRLSMLQNAFSMLGEAKAKYDGR